MIVSMFYSTEFSMKLNLLWTTLSSQDEVHRLEQEAFKPHRTKQEESKCLHACFSMLLQLLKCYFSSFSQFLISYKIFQDFSKDQAF